MGMKRKAQPTTDQWETKFSELSAFKRRYGHTKIHEHRSQYPALSRWANTQRIRYGALTVDQLRRVSIIYFDFPPLECGWLHRFFELVAFRENHGHCNV